MQRINTNPIYLKIPPLARKLMLALTAVHVLGLLAYLYLIIVAGDRSEILMINATIGFLGLPISVCLMSIPAVFEKFPRWVVIMYGEKFLRRLTTEASMAWLIATKKI